jgi:hypothetical protein
MRTWPRSDRPPLGQAGSPPRTRCPARFGRIPGPTATRTGSEDEHAVLLLTGEESTDPSKTQVGAVAAALPYAQRLILAGQQHIADILDPETFAKHLLGFLYGPTMQREPDAIVEVEPLVTGP